MMVASHHIEAVGHQLQRPRAKLWLRALVSYPVLPKKINSRWILKIFILYRFSYTSRKSSKRRFPVIPVSDSQPVLPILGVLHACLHVAGTIEVSGHSENKRDDNGGFRGKQNERDIYIYIYIYKEKRCLRWIKYELLWTLMKQIETSKIVSRK